MYRQAAAWRLDLILTGVMLPEIAGLDTLKLLRQNQATSQILVVFMTAREERTGAQQPVIQKSFDATKLSHEIN